MTFKTLVANLIGLINYIVPVLIAAALAIFFWGLVRMIYRAGDAKGIGVDRQLMTWGLVGLFVMVSVWGIVRVLQEAFLGI